MWLLMVTMVTCIQANVPVCLGKQGGLSYSIWEYKYGLFYCYTYTMQLICYFYVSWIRPAFTLQHCSFIEHHADNEDLPTEISKTTKPMAWNQSPKKIAMQEYWQYSSNMLFVCSCIHYLSAVSVQHETL